MGMKLIQKIRKAVGLTNYGIAKALKDRGYSITIPGVDAYEKENARSMRLDVLCGLRQLSGKSWADFGAWLDEEFGRK